jgi:Zn-dependent M28 family amino/carboxypeptidase
MVGGSDPVLKDEFVVYMAHYDHLGIDTEGGVYNGADDNGSGTTVLLELAEAFSSMKSKPKRSILFLWVTSEEIGMFGSRYYSGHPVVPMGKTAACINIDMVGRVYARQKW